MALVPSCFDSPHPSEDHFGRKVVTSEGARWPVLEALLDMQQKVLEAARSLASRVGNRGLTIPRADFDALAVELDLAIPPWFKELFTTVPICGLELAWQAFEPECDYDGTQVLEWADGPGMRSESLECYPGCVIREHGFVSVGGDATGGGNPYFINLNEGEDPALYQIDHDISDQAAEIIASGRRLVSKTLSAFLMSARPL
jgi:hypothetical protein